MRIRQWYAQRSMDADVQPVAAVNVMLTAEGRVQATTLGLEPEQRPYIAAELRRIADQICPLNSIAVA